MTDLDNECERLRALAHSAPLAKIGERHTGERHILEHTSAWAKDGDRWVKACEQRDALKPKFSREIVTKFGINSKREPICSLEKS